MDDKSDLTRLSHRTYGRIEFEKYYSRRKAIQNVDESVSICHIEFHFVTGKPGKKLEEKEVSRPFIIVKIRSNV